MKLTEKTRVLCPQGTHLGICFAIIDLGTQTSTYKNRPKHSRKLLIRFETPEEKHEFKEGKGPEPFSVGERFTASLSKKAILRGFLVSWRGRDFSDEETEGFDPKVFLGKPAMISVVHKDGWANIKGAVKVPKNTTIPEPHNPLVFLSLEKEEFDEKVFNSLHSGIKDTIALSPEFKALGINYKPGESKSDEEDGDSGAGSDSDTEW